MKSAKIAPVPDLANQQHYEVPEEFFGLVMGKHRKYSSCLWNEFAATLDEAETEALRETCTHASIKDGMRVLDLGCGWGSLSLWIAKQFPRCKVVSVSNSNSQREYITAQAEARGLSNMAVITCDMNDFDTDRRFDRIVSVEMFEHMRNYPELYRRISTWLANKDAARADIMPIMARTYGSENAEQWFGRWRIFFMACAELFGHDNGQEGYVSHYLFEHQGDKQKGALL